MTLIQKNIKLVVFLALVLSQGCAKDSGETKLQTTADLSSSSLDVGNSVIAQSVFQILRKRLYLLQNSQNLSQ